MNRIQLVLFLISISSPCFAGRVSLNQLVEQAEDLVADEQIESALDVYKAADVLAQKANDNSAREEILSEMAKLHFALQQFPEAYGAASLAIGLVGSHTASTFVDLGIYAFKVEKFTEAEKNFNTAANRASSYEQIARINFHRALNKKAQGKYRDAIADFEFARVQHLKSGDLSSAAERLLDIANTYKENLSDYEKALAFYRKARSEFELTSNVEGQRKVDIDLANAFIQIGQIAQALTLLGTVAKSIDPKAYPFEYARTTQLIANARYRAGEYDSSEALIRVAFQSIAQVKDESKKDLLMIDAFNLMAMIDGSLNRTEQALIKFNNALGLAEKRDFKREQAYLHNNIGFWQRKNGKLAEARLSMNKAIEIDRVRKSEEGLAYDYRNLGMILAAQGDYEGAKQYIVKSMEMSRKKGIRYNTIQSEIGLGDVAAMQNNWPEAYSHYKKALDDTAIYNFKMDEWKAYAGAGRSSYKMGDAAQSIKFLEKAVSGIQVVRDNLQSDESRLSFKAHEEVSKVFENYKEILVANGDSGAVAKLAERWKNL